ncbi:OLC1v1025212C1 [Oldenlandia corymbosa var. corymbosa]|uniref:OLC1v1025212C1 n=1 Tax=Oldenlandia corymbosa var. corymbosa TaxID=529605 RepID=A0AAV1C7J6_OLDCO|nr:OLC1v1025212C1 [Oldenlandia corymbosa var. corymbosa]
MKRKRDSKPCRTKKQIPQADEKIEQMGTSILDVPDSVLIDIVLRLPIKAVIMCKCVCKPWRRVISDRHFAKRHFAKAEPCPLIRTIGGSRVSRMLYLIEPSEINVNYDVDSDDEYSSPDCGVNLKLDTKLKIPLRNVELVTQNNTDPKFNSRAGKGGLKKRCVKVTTKEQKFQIVNSCNGFLCLCDPVRNNPLVVCNPITGEYLKLPKTEESNESVKDMVCGLGFSNISNQYKVLRIFDGRGKRKQEWERCRCPITGSIVNMDREKTDICDLGGSLYWIVDELGKPEVVHSFDFGKEKFGALKLPPYTSSWGWSDQSKMTLGMLGGRLTLCHGIINMEEVKIWLLEKNGGLATWKIFKTIDLSYDDRWPLGSYWPINFRKDKGLLMFQSPKSAFFYYEPKFGSWKYFRIYHVKAKYESVSHIPSFVMLKDVVKGDCVEILNVNSKCLEFKLPGETKPIFLVQEIRDLEIDTDASGYSDDEDEDAE